MSTGASAFTQGDSFRASLNDALKCALFTLRAEIFKWNVVIECTAYTFQWLLSGVEGKALILLSGCYYYDYVVIGVLSPSWFIEILF